MIVLNLINFHKDILPTNWYQRVEEIRNCAVYYIVDQKWTQLLKQDASHFIILPERLEFQIRQIYHDEENLAYVSANEEIEEVINFFKETFYKLKARENICAVYSFCANKSLEKVSREMGLYMKYIEFSALRKEAYFTVDLCWFLNNPVIYSGKEGNERYKKFNRCREDVCLKKPISPLCIFMLGAKKEMMHLIIKAYYSDYEYEIGVGLPGPRREICAGWMPDKIIALLEQKYPNQNILYREHPGHNNLSGSYKDLSYNSLDFISRCHKIVSAGSNILFEAMMLGREVADFTNIFFSDVIAHGLDYNEKCTYDDWYINFMVFDAYVPLKLLFDEKYVNWRKENPSEAEIFNCHYNFLCNGYFEVPANADLTDIFEWENVFNSRLTGCALKRDEYMTTFFELSKIRWNEQQIIICGTGKDALLLKRIVENFGGKVQEFLVMDGDRTANQYDGVNIVIWGEHDYFDSDVFIISQRRLIVQKDVLLSLRKAGYKNIICL